MTAAIEARRLSKSYRTSKSEVRVLNAVDFDAKFGQLTMIAGPSGSGKSTLVGAVSGLLRPDAGTVNAVGQDLWQLKQGKLEKFRLLNCGFVFQGFNLFPALNAVQQVSLVLGYCGLPKAQAREKALHALDEVGLSSKASLRPSEMSGGEKQRVAIARALAKDPKLIFADEPTSALDTENGYNIVELLMKAAKTRDAAVVVVTHDTKLEAYADRIVRMEDGSIVSGTPGTA